MSSSWPTRRHPRFRRQRRDRRFPAPMSLPGRCGRRRTASSTCSAGRDYGRAHRPPLQTGFAAAGRTAPCPPAGALHDSVEAALQHLRTALRDSRSLASYAFHAGAVPAGGAPRTEILPDGRNLARLPDPLADPALAGDAFEFTEHRDMLAYATELMAAIEVFVNRVLDAFAAQPAEPRSLADRHPTWTREGWRSPGADRGSRRGGTAGRRDGPCVAAGQPARVRGAGHDSAPGSVCSRGRAVRCAGRLTAKGATWLQPDGIP